MPADRGERTTPFVDSYRTLGGKGLQQGVPGLLIPLLEAERRMIQDPRIVREAESCEQFVQTLQYSSPRRVFRVVLHLSQDCVGRTKPRTGAFLFDFAVLKVTLQPSPRDLVLGAPEMIRIEDEATIYGQPENAGLAASRVNFLFPFALGFAFMV